MTLSFGKGIRHNVVLIDVGSFGWAKNETGGMATSVHIEWLFMKIHELILPSTNIDQQEEVYSQRLGFPCHRASRTELQVSCGVTQLKFIASNRQYYYHYCFLVPPGCLPAAAKFLDAHGFESLPYHGKRLVDFSNGKSVYFYDGDGNIAEFIQRPSLGHPRQLDFSASSIIRLNEIGIPAEHPREFAARMINDFQIRLVDNAPYRDDFIWCGDFEGVFLITKIGRPWMPCQKPAEKNPLTVRFETDAGEFEWNEAD